MTDVFNTDPSEVQTEVLEDKNYLEELVGEGKKFKDVGSLAKGKAEADAYIETLTRKLDALSEEVNKRKTAEEIADQLRSQMADRSSSSQEAYQPPVENENDGQSLSGNNNNKLSMADIEKLVEERLQKDKELSKAQQNVNTVNERLVKEYGASAPKVLQDKAVELGVSVEYLKQQAQVSPQVFFNLVGLGGQKQVQANFVPPQSSMNTASSEPSGTVRNKSFYDKLYRENPHLRSDSKTTIQEHRDAVRLGEKFYE